MPDMTQAVPFTHLRKAVTGRAACSTRTAHAVLTDTLADVTCKRCTRTLLYFMRLTGLDYDAANAKVYEAGNVEKAIARFQAEAR